MPAQSWPCFAVCACSRNSSSSAGCEVSRRRAWQAAVIELDTHTHLLRFLSTSLFVRKPMFDAGSLTGGRLASAARGSSRSGTAATAARVASSLLGCVAVWALGCGGGGVEREGSEATTRLMIGFMNAKMQWGDRILQTVFWFPQGRQPDEAERVHFTLVLLLYLSWCKACALHRVKHGRIRF